MAWLFVRRLCSVVVRSTGNVQRMAAGRPYSVLPELKVEAGVALIGMASGQRTRVGLHAKRDSHVCYHDVDVRRSSIFDLWLYFFMFIKASGRGAGEIFAVISLRSARATMAL